MHTFFSVLVAWQQVTDSVPVDILLVHLMITHRHCVECCATSLLTRYSTLWRQWSTVDPVLVARGVSHVAGSTGAELGVGHNSLWRVSFHLFKCNTVSMSRPPLWASSQSSWLQKGYVLCFMWGTNWIYICYVEESRDRLCGLVVRVLDYRCRGPGFDSRALQKT
jgi:hypothetical protein